MILGQQIKTNKQTIQTDKQKRIKNLTITKKKQKNDKNKNKKSPKAKKNNRTVFTNI